MALTKRDFAVFSVGGLSAVAVWLVATGIRGCTDNNVSDYTPEPNNTTVVVDSIASDSVRVDSVRVDSVPANNKKTKKNKKASRDSRPVAQVDCYFVDTDGEANNAQPAVPTVSGTCNTQNVTVNNAGQNDTGHKTDNTQNVSVIGSNSNNNIVTMTNYNIVKDTVVRVNVQCTRTIVRDKVRCR